VADIEALRDGDIRRVIYVEVPRGTRQRGLVAAILGAYGYKAREHWNTSEIIEKINFYAEQMKTELILIDEGHRLVNETNPESTEELAEFITSLLNRVKVQIVIAGLPRLLKLKRFKQLDRRLEPSIILTPYNWATKKGRILFSGVLGVFEKNLELPQPSGLWRHDFAKRFYVATGAEIGIVSKYLSRGLLVARKRNLPCITKELMGEVHGSWNPEVAVDEIVDFDAILDDEDEAQTKRRAVSENNPFLCADSRLKALWAEHIKVGPEVAMNATAKSGGGSRKTRLKATGRQAFTPFTRT
jgi:hypothetical protein